MANEIDTIDVKNLVLSSLEDLLAEVYQEEENPIASPDESTRLIGRKGVLTSLELVTLIVNIEQTLSDDHNISVTIADERAMSQEKSPFRTVGSLAEYISLLIQEQKQDVSV